MVIIWMERKTNTLWKQYADGFVEPMHELTINRTKESILENAVWTKLREVEES